MRKEFYAVLIRSAHEHGNKFFLDTSGEALRLGLEAGPDFVKPNRQEAERLTGSRIVDRASAVKAMQWLLAAGAKSAAISLGGDGLFWCPGKGREVYFAAAMAMPVRSSVGCGDATVAAFAYAAVAASSPEESLRLAAACGAANTLGDSPGAVRKEDIRRLQKEIHVEKIT